MIEGLNNITASLPPLDKVGYAIAACYGGRNFIQAIAYKAAGSVTGNEEYNKAASSTFRQAKSDAVRDLTAAVALGGLVFGVDYIHDNFIQEKQEDSIFTRGWNTVKSTVSGGVDLAWDHPYVTGTGVLGVTAGAVYKYSEQLLKSGAWAWKMTTTCCGYRGKPDLKSDKGV